MGVKTGTTGEPQTPQRRPAPALFNTSSPRQFVRTQRVSTAPPIRGAGVKHLAVADVTRVCERCWQRAAAGVVGRGGYSILVWRF